MPTGASLPGLWKGRGLGGACDYAVRASCRRGCQVFDSPSRQLFRGLTDFHFVSRSSRRSQENKNGTERAHRKRSAQPMKVGRARIQAQTRQRSHWDRAPAGAAQAAGLAGGVSAFDLAALDASIHSHTQSAAQTMTATTLHLRPIRQPPTCTPKLRMMRIR
jgi:hypothetical protein